MACHLNAPSHYLNQCWNMLIGHLGNKLQWNFNWNSNSLIAENTFENVVCECCSFRLGLNVLTLNLRGPSYLGLTRSISWLLMPWLLASPGHQQPWYWLCRIGKSLSYSRGNLGWVGLWGFLWWAPSAKGKDHHGVSSGWSSVWHRSNTGLSSTQYEQIPIILGIWPFWLTPFFFRSITFWRAYG